MTSLNDYLLDPTKAAAYDRLGIVGILIVVLVLVLGGGLALIGSFVVIFTRLFSRGIAFLTAQTKAMDQLSARHEALQNANTVVLDRFSDTILCLNPKCEVRARMIPSMPPVLPIEAKPSDSSPPPTTTA